MGVLEEHFDTTPNFDVELKTADSAVEAIDRSTLRDRVEELLTPFCSRR
jgi:hypothetical protein